ncbi:serine proteinase stubble-like [Anopheles maculipalpis]|uniref:serine proteinase stubble-like n=1 Tax=Anopheles maculipalpis TaxID=1496333 RepID=UPI0021598961|nr:serine proteinase stubble-like [Anopheles maculipalpis]
MSIMSARWRLVVGRAVAVILLVGYFPTGTIQSAVDGGQQERCTTSNSRAGYCMPKEKCHDQEILDLRTSHSCSDTSQYCCPVVADTVPSWSRRKQFTECDSNRGYCVKSDMCSVRTFRLRSNRCPSFEEVCCPKNTFPEESITSTAPARIATSTIASPTSIVAATVQEAIIPSPIATNETNYLPTPQLPEHLDVDCTDCDTLSSSNASKIDELSKTTTTTESLGSETISTTDPNEEIEPTETPLVTNLGENTFQEAHFSNTSPNTPLSSNTTNTLSSLLPEFTSENFSYHACGQRNPSGVVEHIINEEFRAEYGEFPWMVALLELPEKRYCCNGALIDRKVILTTAHCVTRCGGKVAQMVVRVGEWNMSSTEEMAIPREEFGVKSVHIHPSYFPSSLINNIAVLVLKDSIHYQPTVQPVCLPSIEQQLRGSENMIATGWGAMVGANASFSQILKRLDLQRVETTICQKELKTVQSPYRFELHRSFVCVGANHPDQERPCDGDAGSPVVVEIPNTVDRYYLHGLVSWGYNCNQKRVKHTVLTHVAHFRNWIDDIVLRTK